MPVQPDTRRLAVVSDLTAFVPLTQKGAASGVATLGTDGRLPVAQLPVVGSTVLAHKATATSGRTTVTTGWAAGTNDPDLMLPVVVGRYLVELCLHATLPTANYGARIGGTATATQLGPGRRDFFQGGNPLVGSRDSALLTTGVSSALDSTGATWMLTAAVTVTAAGNLGAQWGTSNATYAAALLEGSWLRLTRLS